MTEEKYTAEQLEQMADQLLQEAAPAQDKPAKGGLDEKTIASLPAAALLNGNEKLRDLFTKGKKKGKLDAGELSDVLDELDLESEQMDSIYDSLEQLGIEVGSEDFLADLPDEDGEPAMDEIAEIEEEELVDPNTLVDSFNIDDPVRMYLKEIGRVPLLNADEEVVLATAMSAGRAAQERIDEAAENGETIPDEELAQLKKDIKEGSKAKQKLAEARSTTLRELREKAETSNLPEDAQAANDFENKCIRFEKKLHDLELDCYIQCSRWLICNQNPRIADHGCCNHYSLPHTTG